MHAYWRGWYSNEQASQAVVLRLAHQGDVESTDFCPAVVTWAETEAAILETFPSVAMEIAPSLLS